MRTNDLRKHIQARLKSICNDVFYEVADDGAMYPHIVYELRSVDLGDLSRQDYVLEVHLWDKSTRAVAVENMADAVADMFNASTEPQESILPTFYLIDRQTVIDEDKAIRHKVVRIQIQNYVKE